MRDILSHPEILDHDCAGGYGFVIAAKIDRSQGDYHNRPGFTQPLEGGTIRPATALEPISRFLHAELSRTA